MCDFPGRFESSFNWGISLNIIIEESFFGQQYGTIQQKLLEKHHKANSTLPAWC